MKRAIRPEGSNRYPDIRISAVDPGSAEGARMLEKSTLDLASKYSAEHIHTASLSDLKSANATFLVAWRSGNTVGCGAIVPGDDKTAEIKRMFVDRSARRTGVGRRLLRALEDAAVTLKFEKLRLETGDRQPEAVALYESEGYKPIERFGEYLSDPHSLCYEKILAAGTGLSTGPAC